MRLQHTVDDERFRADWVAWLDANAPTPEEIATDPPRSSGYYTAWGRRWVNRLFDGGWLVPGWPPELGGRNATARQQLVYFEELCARQLPRSTNWCAIPVVAPLLVGFATPEQRERFLMPTMRAEISWCLGMSEPGAGSDLGGLQTQAVLDGDRFVVNGQKIWTSGALHSDWCVLFCRTDRTAPKHKGISCLLLDLRLPGVEVRPIADLHGHPDLCEVFLTDVEVPAENLVGQLNGGWALTQASLAEERATLWIDQVQTGKRAADALVALAAGLAAVDAAAGRPSDVRTRDLVAGLYIDAQAGEMVGYRGFHAGEKGQAAPQHSLMKLYSSELIQRIVQAGAELLGPAGLDSDAVRAPNLGPGLSEGPGWLEQYLRTFALTVPGGTSEIQRNIIAERVLGLPRR
jgi:alkylation response protein AidB-like acyl-CoA dehydrogenase